MQPLFHIEHVTFHTREPSALCPALGSISLDIQPGEHIICYHPYGVGSVVFLYLLAGLIAPVQGRISLGDGHALCRISLFAVQNRLLSLRTNCALQQTCLIDDLSASELEEMLFRPVIAASIEQQQIWLHLLLQSGSSEDLLLLDRLFRHMTPEMEKAYLDTLFRLRTEYALTIVSSATSLSEAILLGSRILLFGKAPVTICQEYLLPFGDASPAARIQHPDYHQIYQELSDKIAQLR